MLAIRPFGRHSPRCQVRPWVGLRHRYLTLAVRYRCQTDQMRAERLLSLLILLRRRGVVPASVLAAELEVSSRTVLRDIDALSAAGVPVYAERGRAGGFALLPGWTTDLTGLTRSEAAALLTAGSLSRASTVDGGRALGSALRKLTASMPESQRDEAAAAAARILVVADGWTRVADDVPYLGVLQQAVVARRRVRIRYARAGTTATERTVDPHGLVSAAGRWYLLADHRRAPRTYRVSRIAAATVLDEPAGVDEPALAERWERARAGFRERVGRYPVRVRCDPEIRPELVRTALSWQVDGNELAVEFADHRHATTVLWALAPRATAVGPPSLVAELSDRASAAARSYPANNASTAAAPPSPDTPPPRREPAPANRIRSEPATSTP